MHSCCIFALSIGNLFITYLQITPTLTGFKFIIILILDKVKYLNKLKPM